jgi:hypothetical protein
MRAERRARQAKQAAVQEHTVPEPGVLAEAMA